MWWGEAGEWEGGGKRRSRNVYSGGECSTEGGRESGGRFESSLLPNESLV